MTDSGAAPVRGLRSAPPGAALVLDLAACADVADAGAKARNLGRLLRAGLPVPPGVALLGSAWRSAASAGGLEARVARDLAALDRGRLPAVAQGLVDACRALPLPAALSAELERGLRGLPPGPLAVRSSAHDEDGERASAAGQFTTLLGVAPPGVPDAVRACWGSLVAPAALAYRLDRGLPLAGLAMAVVVQRQVEPRAAGVLFTPGRRGGPTLIEAVAGAGEALVSGERDPTRWEVAPDGAVTFAGGAEPELLDAAALRRLAELGQRAEAALGEAGRDGVDVEWAIEGDRRTPGADRPHAGRGPGVTGARSTSIEGGHGAPWLLQARPVTRIAPRAARVRWTAANTHEALLDPVTPLTWSLFAPLIEKGRRDLFRAAGLPEVEGPGYMKLFHGLPYFNPGYFRAFLRLIPGAPEGIFDALIFGEGSGRIDLRLPDMGLRTARLLALFLLARLAARERFELFLRVFDLRLRWLVRRDVASLDDEALVALRRRATDLVEQALGRHVLGTAISGAAYLLLDMFLRRTGVDRVFEGKLVGQLVAGAPGNALARSSEALERLVSDAAERPGLARAIAERFGGAGDDGAPDRRGASLGEDGRWFRRRLDEFLRRHGHRCEKEAELLEPRWGDDPSVLLSVIGGAMRAALDPTAPRPDRLAAREERLARRARTLAGRIGRHLARASLLERVLPCKRLAFRALLREARRYAPYRENLKDSALRALHLVRRLFLDMGRRLASRGVLLRPEDAFFLELDELEGALLAPPPDEGALLRERVAARRAERAAQVGREPPRHVIEVPGEPPRDVHAPRPVDGGGGGLLEGVGASPGRVTATARVLRGMEDAARLGPGEVIVARVVNAGWTPLFHLASGVVTEVGGVLSHAAIVAREYGLPAVFGVAGATRIEDGARITVDGDAGLVTVLAGDSAASPRTPPASLQAGDAMDRADRLT